MFVCVKKKKKKKHLHNCTATENDATREKH